MDKNDKRLTEAFIDIVKPDTTERDQVVMEYLNSYFGDALNESTTDDDIIEAFTELLETADAVRGFMIDEGLGDVIKKTAKGTGRLVKKTAKKAQDIAQHPTTKKVAKKTGRVVKGAATVAADAVSAAGQSARRQTGI